MEQNTELFMFIYNGRYYVGKKPEVKGDILLLDVVEFTADFTSQEELVHLGFFVGDLFPLKTTEYLFLRVNQKCALYKGYFEVVEKTGDREISSLIGDSGFSGAVGN